MTTGNESRENSPELASLEPQSCCQLDLLFLVDIDPNDFQRSGIAVRQPVSRRSPCYYWTGASRLKGVNLLSRLCVCNVQAGAFVTASDDETTIECPAWWSNPDQH